MTAAAPSPEPPQAMSVRTNSPLWRPDCFEIGPRFDVLLDGEPVPRVIAFDCDEGWVQAHRVDGDGRMQIEGGEVAEHVLTGTVATAWR